MIIEFYCSYGLIVLVHVPNDIQINKKRLGVWFESGVKLGYIKRAKKLTGFRSRKTNKWINRYLVDFNDVDENWREEIPKYEFENELDKILE